MRGGDHGLRKGDRVRIRPRANADIFDLALAGRDATVDSIERDFEGRYHVGVVVDDDPGVALGPRRPGHRFFFAPDEVERLDTGSALEVAPVPGTVLVAGIGNIFLGDDGFGVEVVRRLANRPLPAGVRLVDYGIRGFDLAYALAEGPERTILIDACPRGDAPGTVYVLAPDAAGMDEEGPSPAIVDAHTMNPLHVLGLARSMGARLHNVLLVGCEPGTLGPEEGQIGLSDPVEAAVDRAVAVVESLISAPQAP
jgi:hydrogenase maturation protease